MPTTILRQTAARRLKKDLIKHGYAFVRRDEHDMRRAEKAGLEDYRSSFHQFRDDQHLGSGEGQRRRAYGRFLLRPRTAELSVFEHDTFFQSAHFDKLYGDIHRHFWPLGREHLSNRFFTETLVHDFFQFPITESQLDIDWEVSAHLIRIMAVQGNERGRPAPEGIHQDGYHFGVARLLRRENLLGAESRVHRLDKEIIDRRHLVDPLDALYMNDRAIYHSVEPFEAADLDRNGVRDVLISLYQPLVESPQKPGEILPLNDEGIETYCYKAQLIQQAWANSQ